MAKQIAQFRYYQDATPQKVNQNQPSNLSLRQLVSGSAFVNYIPIVQLGIQTLPGTKFYVNNSNNPIIIGNTGIYELDINGLSEITSLQFDQSSIQNIKNNNNAYLIVDIIYEDGED